MSIHQDLIDQYQHYLDELCVKIAPPATEAEVPGARQGIQIAIRQGIQIARQPNKICIVGAGMAGLYSALMLKHYTNSEVKIFEASDRIGGRVYTHRFSDEPHQYFEAGAMRLPGVESQKPLFDLIKYLNERTPGESRIDLIPYHYSSPSGNLVYVNGTKQKDSKIMSVEYADNHLDELGFPEEAEATVPASKLLEDAIQPVIDEFRKSFKKALKKYDHMSLHYRNCIGQPKKLTTWK